MKVRPGKNLIEIGRRTVGPDAVLAPMPVECCDLGGVAPGRHFDLRNGAIGPGRARRMEEKQNDQTDTPSGTPHDLRF